MRSKKALGRIKKSSLQALPDFRSGVSRVDSELSKRRQRNQRNQRSRRAITGLASLLLLTGAIWLVFTARITTIETQVTTDDTRFVPLDQPKLNTAVDQYLNESFLNRWFVDEARLQQQVLSSVPEAESITVAAKQGKTLVISAAGRKRAVVWQKGGQFYEVDTSGVVFKQSSKDALSENVHVVDKSGLPVEVGGPVATAVYMRQIEAIISASSTSESVSISRFIAPESPREIHFKIKGRSFVVKTTIDQSPAVVIASLEDVVKYFIKNNVSADTTVDLRVAGRAIYR